MKSPPSTLTAASGHPKTTGSLPAYPWYSNPPPHCSILLSASTQVFLSCLSAHDLEEARDWPSKMGGQTVMPCRQWPFLIHSLRVKSPKEWLPLEQVSGDVLLPGGRISCLTRQSSIGSHSKWTFTFPSLKNIFGQTEFSHNFIMLSTQTSGN